MKSRILLFALFNLTLVSCRNPISPTTEKWPESIAVLSVEKDTRTISGDFVIAIYTPENQEMRSAGGTGGRMFHFTITRSRDKKIVEFYTQSVCAVLLPSWEGFPQFEIWGRGGGGYWGRSLYRCIAGEYKSVRYDEFKEWPQDGNENVLTVKPPFRPHGEGDDQGTILYFIETRKPSTF